MGLHERDTVVIEKAVIKDSNKNECDSNAVDTCRQVDLVKLLGGNWPNTAGHAGTVLNNTMKPENSSCINNNDSTRYNHPTFNQMSLYNSLHHQNTSNTKLLEKNRQKTSDASSYNKKLSTNKFLNSDISSEMNKCVPASIEKYVPYPSGLDILPSGLDVGSMVEILFDDDNHNLYGVIKWINTPQDSSKIMVAVELEETHDNTDVSTGMFKGLPINKCQEGRVIMVKPDQCVEDKRFVDAVEVLHRKKHNSKLESETNNFGHVECPSVPGAVPPLKKSNLDELKEICGQFKGIQGHHNSCYLDATLFSMFAFTHVFDSLLFRESEIGDISNYNEVQKVLREEIVNPLRMSVFVRADRVMKLRLLLDKLSSVSGLTSEEKDPEEFLNSLLAQIMRVEPFLKLNSGQDAYYYQLFVEKDERLLFPSVQHLFEQSFHSSDIKLKEVPSCLIIQMPRFGKNFKMYSRILPSQILDVTDIIEDSPRQCSVCGKLAEYECRECFGNLQSGIDMESTAFCKICLDTIHSHSKRIKHKYANISVPQDFKSVAEHTPVSRLYMELFAVVCIETSHYVAFVKTGSGPYAPWCFFDSMADREGEKNGYNIPEMIPVPDLPLWLSEDGARTVNETSSSDKMLPEHAKRLFCDAYMCMYQSTDVMMYR